MELQSTPMPTVGRPAARRLAARAVPQISVEHAHLTLEALREYRKALTTEEGRVSYWRRILQARLDVVRAGNIVDSSHLRPVLSGPQVDAGRTALIELLPADDIPPLPDLTVLWDRMVDPSDPDSAAGLTAELWAAEVELSAYRNALHARIGAATGELIARYREQPSLCLTALPLPPQQRTVPA